MKLKFGRHSFQLKYAVGIFICRNFIHWAVRAAREYNPFIRDYDKIGPASH